MGEAVYERGRTERQLAAPTVISHTYSSVPGIPFAPHFETDAFSTCP